MESISYTYDEEDIPDYAKQPGYLFYFIPAMISVLWLVLIQPCLFCMWLCGVAPVLWCMSCCCKRKLKKIYKYIVKFTTAIFRFVETREVSDEDGIKAPRFIIFGYIAPPAYTFHLFFLCIVTSCFTLVGFWNAFLLDTSDICNPYDDFNCFTIDGERVEKPLERPTNSSELTCFNQTEVQCFMFAYDTESGITMGAALLTISWITIFVLTWMILKCSGGRGSGCYIGCPRRCCRRRCWCSCGCRCVVTLLFQSVLLVVPQIFLLGPFIDFTLATVYKNYFNIDTTASVNAIISSDTLKLMHISAIILNGVFVPWCWVKKVPPNPSGDEWEEGPGETDTEQCKESTEIDANGSVILTNVMVHSTDESEDDTLEMEVFHV